MSQTVTENKTCVTGKVMHKSLLAANNTFYEMMKDNKVKDKHLLNVYYCHECGSFHVGHYKEDDE